MRENLNVFDNKSIYQEPRKVAGFFVSRHLGLALRIFNV